MARHFKVSTIPINMEQELEDYKLVGINKAEKDGIIYHWVSPTKGCKIWGWLRASPPSTPTVPRVYGRAELERIATQENWNLETFGNLFVGRHIITLTHPSKNLVATFVLTVATHENLYRCAHSDFIEK